MTTEHAAATVIDPGFLAWFFCALTGLLTGMTELLQRYSRGTPVSLLLFNSWGLIYLAVNVGVALFAFVLVRSELLPEIRFSLSSPGEVYLAAVASGLAGMVILRSQLVSIRVDHRQYPVGFGLLLDILSEQIDHRLDQERAVECSGQVFTVMEGVDPEKAARSLAPLALQVLERTSEKTQKEVSDEIDAILASAAPIKTKSMLIGIAIHKIAGIKVLRHAINSLGEDIRISSPSAGDHGPQPNERWGIIEEELSVAKQTLLRGETGKTT